MKFSPEYISLKSCSASFSRRRSASFLISTLNFFHGGVLKVSSCSGYDLTLLKADGEWLFSCQFFSGFGYFNLQCSSPPTSPIPHCPNPWITHTPWRVSRGNSSNVLFFSPSWSQLMGFHASLPPFLLELVKSNQISLLSRTFYILLPICIFILMPLSLLPLQLHSCPSK